MKPSSREHAIKSTAAAIAGPAQRTAHRADGGSEEINLKPCHLRSPGAAQRFQRGESPFHVLRRSTLTRRTVRLRLRFGLSNPSNTRFAHRLLCPSPLLEM